MIKSLSIPLTTALLLAAAQPAWADHGKNFHCSGIPFTESPDKEAVDKLAHNNGMRKILFYLAMHWENQEMKRLCEAAASGEEIDQSCFDGRRDWDAIAATIPEGLAGKSNPEIRPTMLEIGKREYHTTERREALKFCADLGVIDKSFK